MTTLAEAHTALVSAARGVDGLTAVSAAGAMRASLPCVVVGAPSPEWGQYDTRPTGATFPVTLAVRFDDQCIEVLLALVAAVQAAIEETTPGIVVGATPLSYDLDSGVTAAAYQLDVVYPL